MCDWLSFSSFNRKSVSFCKFWLGPLSRSQMWCCCSVTWIFFIFYFSGNMTAVHLPLSADKMVMFWSWLRDEFGFSLTSRCISHLTGLDKLVYPKDKTHKPKLNNVVSAGMKLQISISENPNDLSTDTLLNSGEQLFRTRLNCTPTFMD